MNGIVWKQPVHTEKTVLLLKTKDYIISTQQRKGAKYLKPTIQILFWVALAIDILVYLNQTVINVLSVSDNWKILRRKKR